MSLLLHLSTFRQETNTNKSKGFELQLELTIEHLCEYTQQADQSTTAYVKSFAWQCLLGLLSLLSVRKTLILKKAGKYEVEMKKVYFF